MRENEDDLGKHRLRPEGWSLDQPSLIPGKGNFIAFAEKSQAGNIWWAFSRANGTKDTKNLKTM